MKSSGSSLRLIDDADDDAAFVHERAFVQAGGGLEVDRGEIAAAGADVLDEQKEREERGEPEQREEADDRLSIHIGIGPTSLPCRNCCTIGLGEDLISSTVPYAMIAPSKSIAT